jgi:hypothetical protein
LADQKYRATQRGKEVRRQQSERYRKRCKERQMETKKPDDSGSEGDTKGDSQKKSCCHRPGCYVRFIPQPQSPHQKYCSPECYKAMRRVLIREQRWRERLRLAKKRGRDGPDAASSERLSE